MGTGGPSLLGIATDARAARDGNCGADDSYEGIGREGIEGASDDALQRYRYYEQKLVSYVRSVSGHGRRSNEFILHSRGRCV